MFLEQYRRKAVSSSNQGKIFQPENDEKY